MDWLRIYLLAGLIGHKVLWEILRRQARTTGKPSGGVRLVKAAKVAMLAAVMAQTLLPEILPITEPGGTLVVLGVCLYTLGLGIAILGRVQLGGNWSDIEDDPVAAKRTVVNRGLYRYIRHPIYTGDLLLLCGLELSLNSWLVAGVALMAPVVFLQAVREERLLEQSLAGYRDYCRRTRRFIPYVV